MKKSCYKECPKCKEKSLEYTEVYSWRSSEPDVITAEVICQSCGRTFLIKETPKTKEKRGIL